MELRHLRYFLAVADPQNFSRAAETVHVAQPSLSVQIRALEEELGILLFDRLGRKVVLTRAREIFREHAERVMRELEQASQSVQELRGARKGRLVVGSLSTVNSYLIPLLVARFKRRFPGIHLRIQAQPSSDIVASLLANCLDLGICLLPVVDDRLTTTPLFDERLALVAPASFPIRKARLRMQELASLPLVLMPVDYCLRKMIEAECSKVGIEPQVVLEMTSPEGILEAVAEGAGLTILLELYVCLHLRRRRLRTVDLIDPAPRHSVGLVYPTNRYQSLAAREFAGLCRSIVRELLSASREVAPQRIGSVTSG